MHLVKQDQIIRVEPKGRRDPAPIVEHMLLSVAVRKTDVEGVVRRKAYPAPSRQKGVAEPSQSHQFRDLKIGKAILGA